MKQAITIQYSDGPHTLPAIVHGALALHRRSNDRPRDAWQIIHVPSGRMVLEVRGCRAARRVFRAMTAMVGWDWIESDPATKQRLMRAVRALRGLLQETSR